MDRGHAALRPHAPHADAPPVLVFDLDDTLYLERDYVRSGLEAAAALVAPSQRDRVLRACFDAFERMHPFDDAREEGAKRPFDAARVFDLALARCGLARDGALPGELGEAYRLHRPVIRLSEDAARFLAWLPRTVPTGLVSDGPPAAEARKLQALGLLERFDHVVLTGSYGTLFRPPHPRAFAEMEVRFGRTGRSLVFVADDPVRDFVTPRARGWMTVAIDRPGRMASRAAPTPAHEAEARIDALDDLVEVVAALSPAVLLHGDG